ncbi:MAG: hypothetical protein KGL10_03635 [Alphaproteobacteria bacterium]|nr:hypothetical protein [Alphaproteobacteria bacterium]MDE2336382.1 hypothetical protein [Alphaproteobacteria bacterium]
MLEPQVITEHDGFLVVRDDLVKGGTKRRVLTQMFNDVAANVLVYPSVPFGSGPVAVAESARDTGKQAILFYPDRKRENWSQQMKDAEAAGAHIVLVAGGNLKTLMKRARDYAATRPDALCLALGFDTPEYVEKLAEIARALPVKPKEVWCATGTGTISRALQKAWPDAEHHAVVIDDRGSTGNAKRHTLSAVFNQAAAKPPFPASAHFEAKAWGIVKREGRPGALFWNVGV